MLQFPHAIPQGFQYWARLSPLVSAVISSGNANESDLSLSEFKFKLKILDLNGNSRLLSSWAALQGDVAMKLLSLLKVGAVRGDKRKPSRMIQPPGTADAALAARAVLELVYDNPEAAKTVVGQGAIGPLMVLLERGSEEEAADAAALLAFLHAGLPRSRDILTWLAGPHTDWHPSVALLPAPRSGSSALVCWETGVALRRRR